jgi:tetratricopeptide (TPR) repeat protein
MARDSNKAAIEVFYSYSHQDEELREELETHLSMLKRQGVMTGWHDRKIDAGDEWKGEIDQHLNTARVILLLISPHFIASDYCYNIEMRQAMKRHKNGEAKVIPVFLKPCDWKGAPFGKLQALPTDTKPVTLWANRDEAFTIVAKGIRSVVEQLAASPRSAQPSKKKAGPPSLDANAYYIRGIGYLENHDYDSAVADFDRAIQLERRAKTPWLEWDYYHRGLAYYFKNDLDAAIADWNQTINLSSKNAWAHRQRGNALFVKRDYSRALSDYNRAIELDPKVAKAFYNRGLLYSTVGEWKKAMADFRTVLKLDDDAVTEQAAKQQLEAIKTGKRRGAAD